MIQKASLLADNSINPLIFLKAANTPPMVWIPHKWSCPPEKHSICAVLYLIFLHFFHLVSQDSILQLPNSSHFCLKILESIVRIPISMFLTLLALQYIPPYRAKYIFPSICLILQFPNGRHTADKQCMKTVREKKILPLCFVGSSQRNSISHLSFNLLFIVAEHSETYYPEFPSAGVQ